MVVIRQIIFAGLFLALLGLLSMAVNIVRSDLAYSAAEREISFWGRAGYTPGPVAISKAESDIQLALSLWPGQPDYLRVQSRLLMWRAYWSSEEREVAELEARALGILLHSVQQRPAYQAGWEELLLELRRLGRQGHVKALTERQIELLVHRAEES